MIRGGRAWRTDGGCDGQDDDDGAKTLPHGIRSLTIN